MLGVSAPYNRYLPPSTPTSPHPASPVITPSVSPMESNAFDITFEADFLWWTANVTDLSYATRYQVIGSGATTTTQPDKISEFNWDWNPGVRAAVGVNTNYDGWDVAANWTYFYNSFADTKTVSAPIPSMLALGNPPGTALLSNSWSNFSASNSMATRLTGEGGFQMNQVNLELGRHFLLSQRLSLRPFWGVRGHFSHLDFRSKKSFEGTGGSSISGFAEWNDYQKQDFWAVGVLGGFDSSWNVFRFLYIFGSGGLSLCYGPFKNVTHFTTHIRSPDRADVIHDSRIRRNHDQVWTLQQVLDLALGIRLEQAWISREHREAFRMVLDIGWEMHLYPSYNHLDQGTSESTPITVAPAVDAPISYRPASGDLSLSGFVVRGRFEF